MHRACVRAALAAADDPVDAPARRNWSAVAVEIAFKHRVERPQFLVSAGHGPLKVKVDTAAALRRAIGRVLRLVSADYTAIAVLQSTAGMTGAIMGNGRAQTSTTGGTITGVSQWNFSLTDSVLAMNHQTKNGAANTTALISSTTGAAAGASPHLWIASFDFAGGAMRLRKDNAENKAATGITRQKEDTRLILGAGGWDGTTLYNPLRNCLCGSLIFVPNMAAHRTGTGNEANVALLAAVEAYSSGKFATF